MENYVDVLVAKDIEEYRVLRVLYPKQWASYYTEDISGESYMCSRGFLELSLAGFTPVMVPITLAFDERCHGEKTPDGTIIACDGGRFVKVEGGLFPAAIKDYVYVSYEVAAQAGVYWLPR